MILNGSAPYLNMNEPLPNSKVWRYMDFPKFLNIITYAKLYFCRLDKLQDQYEGTLSTNLVNEIKSQYDNFSPLLGKENTDQMARKEINTINNYRGYTLVNSWTQNVEESFALWKIYLGYQPFGIAIQTKYKKLKTSFPGDERMLFQKITYTDCIKELHQRNVPFTKKKFYKFEKEVRIAIISQYEEFNGKAKYENGKYVDVDIDNLIENIYISPFAPDWFCELVRYVIEEKYHFHFPIIKSLIKERN
jgi:hypothetical protein